jgi:hypothetical protein
MPHYTSNAGKTWAHKAVAFNATTSEQESSVSTVHLSQLDTRGISRIIERYEDDKSCRMIYGTSSTFSPERLLYTIEHGNEASKFKMVLRFSNIPGNNDGSVPSHR